ncbi:MAG: GFA family protein [Halioglobus sp.]
MKNEILSGSCLCGAAKYTIEAETMHFFQCHCVQCRKTTSSAFASNIVASPTDIQWHSGEENLRRFDYPGRSFTQVFCGTCGSGLPFLDKSGEMLFIPAGTLDVTPDIQPEANIFWEEKAEWCEHGMNAQKQEGFESA